MLNQTLSQLEHTQLIRQSDGDEPSFLFKHALTQDAAYESLLLRTRRELHERVARAYEQLYPDRLDEHAALLAWHYGEAENARKTLEFSTRAGAAAARVNANQEAIAHYGRAIQMARSLLSSGEDSSPSAETMLVDLFRRRGRLFELNSQYAQAVANYVEMEAEGERRGDAAFRLAAMMERAKLLSTPNPQWDWARGIPLAKQALALAGDLGDGPAQARLLWILMLANYYGTVDLDEAARFGEESIARARELGLREELAFALNDLGAIYQESGQVQRSLRVLADAESLWRELGNWPMLTDTLANTCMCQMYDGNYAAALRISDEGFQLGQSIGNIWSQSNCRMMIGQLLMDVGAWGQAIDVMESTIDLGDRAGHPGVPIVTRALLAWALAELSAVEKGLGVARMAAERGERMMPFRSWGYAVLARLELLAGDAVSAEIHLKEAESKLLMRGSGLSPVFVLLARAELALARRDYAEAIDTADRLLDHLHRTERCVFAGDALFARAKALDAMGQSGPALETLVQAETEAKAVGSRRVEWRILMARAEIESRDGEATSAEALRTRAAEIVHALADSLTQPDLRRGFEQSPAARFAFEDGT